MHILIVLTSHEELGNTGRKTGFWLEEFVAPYYTFLDAGADVTVASPKGGEPPLDPASDNVDGETEFTRRFKADPEAREVLFTTVRLDSLAAEPFDAVFYPGGHGPLWDLAEDQQSIKLIEAFVAAAKPVGAVCHAPGVLRHVVVDGRPLVAGKLVTGFSDSEEAAVGLTTVVPFLVEDELKRLGGRYEKAGNWKSFVLVDGLLATGQNPASSQATAKALMALVPAKSR